MGAPSEDPGRTPLHVLSLAALGIVFGDIGTSPLYAMREAFSEAHGIELTTANVLGVLSLVLWSLVLVISGKYVLFILRADNRGEGGVLALMALVHPEHGRGPVGRRGKLLVLLGLFGATLLFGDGMITPAISVLSAVEGIEVVAPAFARLVIPITVGILIGLFLVQRRGTASVGAMFGPVMLLWFAVLAVLGIRGILLAPEVLAAFDPRFAVSFFLRNGMAGFFVLGAVFLVVTGGEALYADMGHFGARPIRIAWFALVLPALVLNYFGQGALLVTHPETAENPFYLLAPGWAIYPLIAIATAATIIASQAMISGAFSLGMQAIHLGYVPRLRIEHTSATERGQIYIPFANALLAVATIFLVLEFQTSSALANAYGIAVSLDMTIASILFFFVAREIWGWSRTLAAGLVGAFLVLDLAFLAANLPKIPRGGWFPLAVAGLGLAVMTTWWTGRRLLGERLREKHRPVEPFVRGLKAEGVTRVTGTAVFLTGNADATPPALMRIVQHTKVLHKQVLLLTISPEEVARVTDPERVEFSELGSGFYRAVAHYGFMEEPNVPEIMADLRRLGFEHDPDDTTYFLGRERIVTAEGTQRLPMWRAKLFAFLAQNAEPVPAYFRIPPERVVEVGAQIRA